MPLCLTIDCLVMDWKWQEISAVNPHQRIIFTSTSAYIKGTLLDSVRQLNQIVEVMDKPFSEQVLIDTIEDKSIYSD